MYGVVCTFFGRVKRYTLYYRELESPGSVPIDESYDITHSPSERTATTGERGYENEMMTKFCQTLL